MNLQIEHIASYTEHGCNIHGNLVKVDYYEYLTTLPNYGKFSARTFYTALDKAKEVLFAEYPEAKVVLGIPCLVARI